MWRLLFSEVYPLMGRISVMYWVKDWPQKLWRVTVSQDNLLHNGIDTFFPLKERKAGSFVDIY